MGKTLDKNAPWAKRATAITALTDNSGGTASNTVAAIAAGAAYAQADMVAAKNAIASLTAKVNALLGERNSGT